MHSEFFCLKTATTSDYTVRIFHFVEGVLTVTKGACTISRLFSATVMKYYIYYAKGASGDEARNRTRIKLTLPCYFGS